jgi:hypothetical protein
MWVHSDETSSGRPREVDSWDEWGGAGRPGPGAEHGLCRRDSRPQILDHTLYAVRHDEAQPNVEPAHDDGDDGNVDTLVQLRLMYQVVRKMHSPYAMTRRMRGFLAISANNK